MVAVRGRVERDDVCECVGERRLALERRVGAEREAADPRASCRLRRGASAQTTSTRSPVATSAGDRSGGTQVATVANVCASTRCASVAAARGRAGRSSSARTAGEVVRPARPPRRSAPAQQRRASRSTSRGSTAPSALVELEPERRVHAARRRRPAGARRSRTRPRCARAPPDSTVKRTCLPSPIGRRRSKRAAGTSSATAGLPACRRAPVDCELLGEPEAQLVAGDDGVDALDRHQVLGPQRRAPRALRTPRGRRRLVAGDRAARRPRGGRRGGAGARRRRSSPAEQVEAGDRAARAGAAVAVERDQRPRGGGGARRSARRRSRSRPGASRRRRARTPAASPTSATWASASQRIRCSTGRRSRVGARRARCAIGAGAVRVVGEQELERPRRRGAAGPAALMRGAEAEAEARWRRPRPGRRWQPRISARRPGLGGGGQRPEPLADEAAVLAAQRDDSRRPWRGPRGRGPRRPRLPGRSRERPASLWATAVAHSPGTGSRRPRVDDRRVGQRAVGARAWWSVTTHVDAGRARGGDLLDGGDRAVDGDQQLRPARGEPLDRRQRQAVAVVDAAGQVPVDVGPEARSARTSIAVEHTPSTS